MRRVDSSLTLFWAIVNMTNLQGGRMNLTWVRDEWISIAFQDETLNFSFKTYHNFHYAYAYFP